MLVEKIDNLGRGILYDDGKITFIPDTIPGDVIKFTTVKEKKNFKIAALTSIEEKSPLRCENNCEYSHACGGCQFMDLNYETGLNLKVEGIKNYLIKNGIDNEVNLIKSNTPYNYRNKISLKISGTKIGFYEKSSKKIVPITKCAIANDQINKCIKSISSLGINNGFVDIRVSTTNELLISIHTHEDIDYTSLKNYNLVVNKETIYNNNYFVDVINKLNYEVCFDSFFQTNPYITSSLVDIVVDNVKKDSTVLDLYCGVGLFSIALAKRVNKVYALEYSKNAIINANNNALRNNIDNANFKVCDLSKKLIIKDSVDTIVVDPPRSGIDKVVMDNIIKHNPCTIVYISCDVSTFIRDIKLLKDTYNVDKLYLLDMYCNTYHMENICVLTRK